MRKRRDPKKIVRQVRRIHLEDLPKLPFEELENLGMFLLDINPDTDYAVLLCVGYEDTQFPEGTILSEGYCGHRYAPKALKKELSQSLLAYQCPKAEQGIKEKAWQIKTFGERTS